MAKVPRGGTLDDGYKRLLINDFSGGLQLNKGGIALDIAESPFLINVVPFPGRLQYRGGWIPYASFDHAADQAYDFYDSDGDKHFVVWNGGDVEDVVTGTAVSVEAAAYTAGQHVGCVALNGILYWSTESVPIRYWNPVTMATGAVAQTGLSAVPASPFLMLYTNSIVAMGVKFGAAAFQPNVFCYCTINDPGDWDASNSQSVGPNNGGAISFGVVFGIAEVGVAPFRSFVVGRNDEGIYGYSGALGSLQEFLVNCPAGCADGASAQYIPSADKFGTVIFLGTDGQFYATNGITAAPVSTNVLPLLSAQYSISKADADVRYWSGYNEQMQYYFCSVGSYQFVYKWDTGAWSLFDGWPVGPTINAPDADGVPSIFTAEAEANGSFAQVAVPQELDNDSPPLVAYYTPYLHFGDPEKVKEIDWAALFVYQTQTQYQLVAQSMPLPDNSVLTTTPLLFPPGDIPITGGSIFTLDSSLLDGTDVLDGPGAGVNVIGTGTPQGFHGRLSCPVDGEGMLAGLSLMTPMVTGAVQFQISHNGGIMDFEMIGLELRFKERGYLRAGYQGYNPESGIEDSFDPYMPGLEPELS